MVVDDPVEADGGARGMYEATLDEDTGPDTDAEGVDSERLALLDDDSGALVAVVDDAGSDSAGALEPARLR